MENPIEIDELGTIIFGNTHIYIYIYTVHIVFMKTY